MRPAAIYVGSDEAEYQAISMLLLLNGMDARNWSGQADEPPAALIVGRVHPDQFLDAAAALAAARRAGAIILALPTAPFEFWKLADERVGLAHPSTHPPWQTGDTVHAIEVLALHVARRREAGPSTPP